MKFINDKPSSARRRRHAGSMLHEFESAAASKLLRAEALSHGDLERAARRFERSSGVRIGTWIGVNDGGMIGATRPAWQPDQPGAIDDFLVWVSWSSLRALLGRTCAAAGASRPAPIPAKRV